MGPPKSGVDSDSRVKRQASFDGEYFKRRGLGSNRMSTYPAVQISNDKIWQHYGTRANDMTHAFYGGDQTAYFIEPRGPKKHDLSSKIADPKLGINTRPSLVRAMKASISDSSTHVLSAAVHGLGTCAQSSDGDNDFKAGVDSKKCGQPRKSLKISEHLQYFSKRRDSTLESSWQEAHAMLMSSARRNSVVSVSNKSGAKLLPPITGTDKAIPGILKPGEVQSGDTVRNPTVQPRYFTFDNQSVENSEIDFKPMRVSINSRKVIEDDRQPSDAGSETQVHLQRKLSDGNRIQVENKPKKKSVRINENASTKELEGRKRSAGDMADIINFDDTNLTSPTRQILRRDSKFSLDNAGLRVSVRSSICCDDNTSLVKELEKSGSYTLRHEYGKKLEREWYQRMLMERDLGASESPDKRCDLRIDMFYSPEPDTDDDHDDSGDVTEDRNESEAGADLDYIRVGFNLSDCVTSNNKLENIDCQGEHKTDYPLHSHYPAVKKLPRTKTAHKSKIAGLLKENPVMFASTDVLTGESDDLVKTDATDIVTILKGNKLVQKKIKNKMYKKRKRQQKRYSRFLKTPNDDATVNNDDDLHGLTDVQIRAMRLKLKNRESPLKLRGKRKFLQVANAVFVVIQFRHILADLRNSRRRLLRIKLKKRSAKKVTWRSEQEDMYEHFSRAATPVSVKNKFLKELGLDLPDCISYTSPPEGCENIAPRSSKFARELESVSVNDVSVLLPSVKSPSTQLSRRNSAPCVGSPDTFYVDTRKPRGRRRDRSKLDHKQTTRKKQKKNQKSSKRDEHKYTCAADNVSKSRSPSRIGSRCNSGACKYSETQEGEIIDTCELRQMRTGSVCYTFLRNSKAVDLLELLNGIEVPAKEVRWQILQRKMKKQKKKREERELLNNQPLVDSCEKLSASSSKSGSGDEADNSEIFYDYSRTKPTPFVSCGVAWNQRRARPRKVYSTAELDREIKKSSKLFYEMKDCKYIRWTDLDQAIMNRLHDIEDHKHRVLCAVP